MSARPEKRPEESLARQAHILTMADMNGAMRLFGGRLMSWIDEVSTVAAQRHSGCRVTTARVEALEFLAPAHAGDLVEVEGRVTYVGNTSMEVTVRTWMDELSGERTLINEARVTMVALDEQERPCTVPGLILSTDEERQAFAQARARRARHDG